MKKIAFTLILSVCFFTTHAQNNSAINSKLETSNKDDIRGSYTLKFENGDTVKVVSNFFPQKSIDSFSQQNKNIRGKYIYCFKGGLSKKISKILKENNTNFNTNTAHSIIINKDTVFFNGRNKVNCLKENDSVLIKSSIYTFFQETKETKLLIINELIEI
ncbi:hypothetical protein Q4566_15015 [Tamlana sp. 2_MG-2023]|uniref:hypothetical protein n=1 Tax=unclassified Tamlana TaxID=2614803 RepID=UPI0026E18A0C|nr:MULTISPECIES: hypothetical protein [unclassified Tamlana]MDO6761521.1 hypothetical protein [Tamlana sp. 2_MG-2023]MDO6792385.1 hypothetical protein [Tamlana sp. 1_MG-2023]